MRTKQSSVIRFRLGGPLLLMLLLAACKPALSGSDNATFDGVIYGDELKNGFTARQLHGNPQQESDARDDTDNKNYGTASKLFDIPSTAAWGGGFFRNAATVDVSGFKSLVFSIDKSAFETGVDYMELKAEDAANPVGVSSLNLFDYTPVKSGNWEVFTIPLADFTNIDKKQFKVFGLWNSKSGGNNGTAKPSKFYFDEVKFSTDVKSNSDVVWRDEFNGSAVDPSNWKFETGNGGPSLPGWGNNELQYYTSRNENVRIEEVADGGGTTKALVIEARKENFGGHSYTSARMKTQGLKSFTYGRIEARIKLPEGRGVWPAFWMLGENITTKGWPLCGEIDIMELVGHEPGKVHGTLHWGNPGRQYKGKPYTLPAGKKFSQDFHVFAVEWRRGEIRWYVDGNLYQTQRGWTSTLGAHPAPFDRPFFILLNIAVGGQWPGNPPANADYFPQKMYVDYVRVYK